MSRMRRGRRAAACGAAAARPTLKVSDIIIYNTNSIKNSYGRYGTFELLFVVSLSLYTSLGIGTAVQLYSCM